MEHDTFKILYMISFRHQTEVDELFKETHPDRKLPKYGKSSRGKLPIYSGY